ncbi:unnamed protein product [Colias eurytheme]|nr:unnamed protein product [Colias eurytheme]
MLRVRLEEMPESDYYLYVKDMKTLKKDKIPFCLRLYRDIADLLDLILPELHAQIFLSIICGVPKLIYDVYKSLLVIEGMEPYPLLIFSIMHIVHVAFLLFSPSFVIEFFGVEVDRIRLFLIHQIIDNKDQKCKEAAQVFLEYTNIRPFSHKIWRSIPVNIALPLEILNICYSAIIVIINFTHLYG